MLRHAKVVFAPNDGLQDQDRFLSDKGIAKSLSMSKKLAEFDWWMFSRIEAKKDDVFIPYYHHASNKIRNFYPDFIFWLQK